MLCTLYINQLKMTEVSVETCLTNLKAFSLSYNTNSSEICIFNSHETAALMNNTLATIVSIMKNTKALWLFLATQRRRNRQW